MTEELDQLETERARPEFSDLDLRDTSSLVRAMVAEDASVPAAVEAAGVAIAEAVDAITERLRAGGRLSYVGAGTAGRIAALDAAEVAPTFGIPAGIVLGIVAGGSAALADAQEGLEDDSDQGAADLRDAGISSRDAVIGVSASGRTPYALGAVAAARARQALTIALVNNEASALSRLTDLSVLVRTGPEFIAGSTRLKAGTAQKIVLNTISTLVMVKLGHTYGNWMVGVQTDNEKLRRRAARLLCEATGATGTEATEALESAGGDTRTALVMLLADVNADAARRRLEAAGGSVRRATQERSRPS